MYTSFPEGFFWGAALSSYQTEGGNLNTDWSLWEKEQAIEQASGACDHYNLFKRDFQLAKILHLNSFRLSFEWARINPEANRFSSEAIEHYKQVIDELASLKLKPFLTLHHFTNPDWFMKKGGWCNSANIDFFLAYVKCVAQALKGKVDYWVVFNEPLVYIFQGYIQGIWPPGIKDFRQAKIALDNIIKAYTISYQEIKRICTLGKNEPKVSIAKHLRSFSVCPEGVGLLNSFSAFLRDKYFNLNLLDYLRKRNILDYLAVNYYCKEYVQFNGLIGKECDHDHKEHKNFVGWHTSAMSFYDTLIRLKKYRLPIIVTENGTAENQEYLYKEYLESHLKALARACSKGIDIKGYFWWSLLDNFEWEKGFNPRFGLYEVDYKNLRRYPRPFSSFYADVCKYNKIEK